MNLKRFIAYLSLLTYISICFYLINFSLVAVGVSERVPLTTPGNAAANASDNLEQKLLRDIIYSRRIDRYSRPALNHSESVNVKMELWIYNILGLNDQTETFSVNAIQKLNWMDYNLTWNPNEYSNVQHINLPDFLIWKPDIVLVNSINLKEALSNRGWSYVRINNDGYIEYKMPAIFNSHCAVDLQKFPFDEHECQMIFASWNFLGVHLNLSISDSNETNQEKNILHLHTESNKEWEIINWKSAVIYEETGDSENGDKWPKIQYTFHIRRLAPYYKYSILIPVIVIILTSLAVFWFPPSAPEKITLGSFMTLCLTLLLVHLYWVIPRNGNTVPGIVLMCGVAMAFVSLSLIISVFTISISRERHQYPPPHYIRSILSRFFCLRNGKRELEHKILDSADSRDDQAGWEDKSSPNNDWILLAVAIDRSCFILYLISFIILGFVSFF